MSLPWRASPEDDITKVRCCLDEAYPTGPSAEKLRALICCVRRRCKDGGHQRHVIAQRATLTEETVSKLIAGEFHQGQSDSIVALLRAMKATTADLTIAMELYDQICLDRAAAHKAAHPASSPPAVTPGPVGGYAAAGAAAGPGSPASAPPPEPPAAAAGDGEPDKQVPDPMQASSTEQFVTAIKRFRITRGRVSFREMAKASQRSPLLQDGYCASAFNTIGQKGLPTLRLTQAYVVGCGGGREELDYWTKAWTRLALRLDVQGWSDGS